MLLKIYLKVHTHKRSGQVINKLMDTLDHLLKDFISNTNPTMGPDPLTWVITTQVFAILG